MAYYDDAQALGTLSTNFRWERGIVRPKVFGYDPTPEESNAISYLCCDWDYSYERLQTQDADGTIRMYTKDGRCHAQSDSGDPIDTPGEAIDAWENYVASRKPGFPWILMCWMVLFFIGLMFVSLAVMVHS